MRGISSQGAVSEKTPRRFFCGFGGHMSKRYWLMKTEPSVVGIDDVLAMTGQTVDWWGVRNYQARNFMRDQMNVGDGVLFYHSSCAEPGIAGLAEVARRAYPDRMQFDSTSKYHDPKSTPENPRWMNVDVRVIKKTRLIGLDELRAHDELARMRVLQRGNRLSITPVDPAEWTFIVKKLLKEKA
jgi:predicted RNA-binding protein with PUA-like domain